MKIRFLTTSLALSLAAGAVLAMQFTSAENHVNLAALRLEGSWTVDPVLSERLDPSRPFAAPKSLTFVKNDKMVRQLQTDTPRFRNEHIYMGGYVTMDDAKWSYVVTSEYGNAHLVLFKPTPTDPIGFLTTVNLCLACSRDATLDLLFLGGDVPQESAMAYERIPGH